MACRCNERSEQIKKFAENIKQGNFSDAKRNVHFIGRTFKEDVQNGDITPRNIIGRVFTPKK